MLKQLRMKRVYIGLLCLLLVFAILPRSVYAADRIDTERTVSLTLCVKAEQPVANMRFSLYRVAEVSSGVTFTWTEEFQKYSVSLDSGWSALAETLAAYVARDAVAPLDSGATGADGTLRFPNQQSSLTLGLYLVVGEKQTKGSTTYTPTPFLLCLPNLDPETDQWVYAETAYPKCSENENSGGGGGGSSLTVTRKVLKVWNDEGNEEQRPEQIVVQLLRNGKVYDTVTLDEKTGWQYTWSRLDADDTWQVVEETVPEGYTVSVDREGTTFIVTNTYEPDKQEHPDGPDEPGNPDIPNNPDGSGDPDQPDQPDKPGEGLPDRPDADRPGEPGAPEGSETAAVPTLPQTGVLWWPVPVLAGSGMLMFLLGWIKARKQGMEHGR